MRSSRVDVRHFDRVPGAADAGQRAAHPPALPEQLGCRLRHGDGTDRPLSFLPDLDPQTSRLDLDDRMVVELKVIRGKSGVVAVSSK
jgi:hypothetical protein